MPLFSSRFDDHGSPTPEASPSTSIAAELSPLDSLLSFDAVRRVAFPAWLSPAEIEMTLHNPNAYAFKELPDLVTLQALHTRRIRHVLGDVSFLEMYVYRWVKGSLVSETLSWVSDPVLVLYSTLFI